MAHWTGAKWIDSLRLYIGYLRQIVMVALAGSPMYVHIPLLAV